MHVIAGDSEASAVGFQGGGLGLKGPCRHMGVSQNKGYFFGVPIIRIIVYWDLYWGPFILGNYHIEFSGEAKGREK